MKFTKMHGACNDYVFVDCAGGGPADPAELARRMSDRNRGVGGDGLILIHPSDKAAGKMEMYNADGSRGRMCGNGLRCVAKFLFDRGGTGGPEFDIETDAGIRSVRCVLDGKRVEAVTIDMGSPRFDPADIPVRLPKRATVNQPIDVNHRRYELTPVSMGNPHAVVYVDDLDRVDLAADGPAFARLPIFPEGVNVHFVQSIEPNVVRVGHWERGSGATMACGTGAAAVCAVGVHTQRTDRKITATVPGGTLELEWGDDDHIYLTGPAVEVFSGDWPE